MPGEDDKQLVSMLKKAEVKAFDILFHKYSQKLYHFSFSLLKNEEDAKEIVQETFLRIWSKRFEIDLGKSFKSYLFTISYHLIIDRLRLRLKDQEYRNFLRDYFKISDFGTSSKIDYEELTQMIDQVIEELPKKRKRIYKLSRKGGMSNNEIAEELGISVKTVENQITLSLRYLKLRLGQHLLAVILFLSLFP
nr:RNA polymerase sigma-70 factor [uncultured Draconibacterium sp.]